RVGGKRLCRRAVRLVPLLHCMHASRRARYATFVPDSAVEETVVTESVRRRAKGRLHRPDGLQGLVKPRINARRSRFRLMHRVRLMLALVWGSGACGVSPGALATEASGAGAAASAGATPGAGAAPANAAPNTAAPGNAAPNASPAAAPNATPGAAGSA